MNSVIVGYLIGGLGNQLFQIFTIISYSIKQNISFIFPKNKFDKDDRKTYWETDILKKLLPYVVENDKIPELPILWEHEFGKGEDIPVIKGHFKLHGYFQYLKYFKDYYNDIYNFLEIDNAKIKIKQEYNKYFTNENTISIHFRIGDAKDEWKRSIYYILDVEYYKKSLETILKNNQNLKDYNIIFFYEKEDEEEVNRNVKIIHEYTFQKFKNVNLKFIPIDTNIEEWKQLLLMSCCKYNIIANSTFSLWGSYFNTFVDKQITYPSTWFYDKTMNDSTKEMIPKEWIRID